MVKLFDFNGHTPLVEFEVTILKYTEEQICYKRVRYTSVGLDERLAIKQGGSTGKC